MNEKLCLVGGGAAEIYGLPITDWQGRNWGRAGIEKAEAAIVADENWVLSAGLAAAVVSNPGAALMSSGGGARKLIAAHTQNAAQKAQVETLIAEGEARDEAVTALGLRPAEAEALAGHYNKDLRKREIPWAVNIEADGVVTAEKALFKSSYKGVTDFVTKYAWPVPAFAVTRWCAARKISPNTVTTLSLIFVIIAFYCFWQGQWGLGIAAGWLMTFLDTVDGKLARCTLTSSKWGNVYDHGIDLIHPPFWYWAWVEGIKNLGGPVPDWLDTSLYVIVALYVGGRIVEGIFMHTHGFHIHIWGKIDSFMRVITSRRNPNLVIFMIFCLFGAPAEGVLAVAVWTVVCNVFHLVRLFQAGFLKANPPLTSWMHS